MRLLVSKQQGAANNTPWGNWPLWLQLLLISFLFIYFRFTWKPANKWERGREGVREGRQERGRDRKKENLLTSGSLPQFLHQPWLSQANVCSWELNLSLPCGWQAASPSGPTCAPVPTPNILDSSCRRSKQYVNHAIRYLPLFFTTWKLTRVPHSPTCICFYLKGRVAERKRRIFDSLLYSSNGLNTKEPCHAMSKQLF